MSDSQTIPFKSFKPVPEKVPFNFSEIFIVLIYLVYIIKKVNSSLFKFNFSSWIYSKLVFGQNCLLNSCPSRFIILQKHKNKFPIPCVYI